MTEPLIWLDERERDLDRLHEECGIFGIYDRNEDVANLTYFGLCALQHRGQESAGIAASDGKQISLHKEMGLVGQVFTPAELKKLTGHVAIGHTRYSTMGSNSSSNAQPIKFEHPQIGPIAFGHNGNLVNAKALRTKLSQQGYKFTTTSDSEVIGVLIASTPGDRLDVVLSKALPLLEGAYCLLFLTRDSIVATRDPLGIRPLCMGRLKNEDQPGGNGYILASETCALDVVGARLICEIEPGEIVSVDDKGPHSMRVPHTFPKRAMCSFEFIYFARPDSVMMGRSLYEARNNMGRELAKEAPASADIVITMPDSGTPSAIGYAEVAGIPFVEGMIKSRYINRTFIQPNQDLRQAGLRLKFNPMPHVLKDRRVVLVDDSIVRGNTSKQIVEELRKAGAKEVHMRIASPPLMWPCFMGIDIGSRNELIAANNTVEEMGNLWGVDSLSYLSLEGLKRSVSQDTGEESGHGFCYACFDGKYPLAVPEELEMNKLALELAAPKDEVEIDQEDEALQANKAIREKIRDKRNIKQVAKEKELVAEKSEKDLMVNGV